jgi:hypothetical protein
VCPADEQVPGAGGLRVSAKHPRWRAEALVQVLTVKLGPLPEGVPQTVHRASSDQIQAWTARAVTAETLDQVFD